MQLGSYGRSFLGLSLLVTIVVRMHSEWYNLSLPSRVRNGACCASDTRARSSTSPSLGVQKMAPAFSYGRCTEATTQLFKFEHSGDGWGLLRIKHSGKVLDVDGGSQEDGACILQWTMHGGANQLLKFEVHGPRSAVFA